MCIEYLLCVRQTPWGYKDGWNIILLSSAISGVANYQGEHVAANTWAEDLENQCQSQNPFLSPNW